MRDGEKLYEELVTKNEIIVIINAKKIKKEKVSFDKKIYSLNSKKAELLNEGLILKFLKKSKLI